MFIYWLYILLVTFSSNLLSINFLEGFSVFLIHKNHHLLIAPCAKYLSYHLLYPLPPSWRVVPILVMNNLRLREFKQLVKVTQSEWQSWHLSLSPYTCVLNHRATAPSCPCPSNFV